jgi:hypothetical protein
VGRGEPERVVSHNWKDAYESQMAAWRWVRSDFGADWRGYSLRESAAGMRPETRQLITDLYHIEEQKLLDADPYFVSADMVELIEYAAESFEPEPLLHTDLIGMVGYVHFEKPIQMPDKYEVMVALGGFSWTPMIAVNDAAQIPPDGQVEIHMDHLPDFLSNSGVALTLYSVAKLEKWEAHWPPPPPRIPIHHTPWYYGMSFEGNEIDELGARTGVDKWWRVIQTTLRLMQQRVAVRHHERPDRATRRNGIRRGFREREVVVVKLRREKSEHPSEEPVQDANYSHRFIVSGHWRQQWYPSIQGHRQIWISPFVKGPADKELVVRPRRVFNLVR